MLSSSSPKAANGKINISPERLVKYEQIENRIHEMRQQYLGLVFQVVLVGGNFFFKNLFFCF